MHARYLNGPFSLGFQANNNSTLENLVFGLEGFKFLGIQIGLFLSSTMLRSKNRYPMRRRVMLSKVIAK